MERCPPEVVSQPLGKFSPFCGNLKAGCHVHYSPPQDTIQNQIRHLLNYIVEK